MKGINSLLFRILLCFIFTYSACGQDGYSKCIAKIAARLEALGDGARRGVDETVLHDIVKGFDFGNVQTFAVDAEKSKALKRLFESLSEVIDITGDQLSAKGMRGYTRFAGGIIRADGTDFVEELIRVFGGRSNFDKVGFSSLMEQLDSSGTWLAQGKWKSEGGIIYSTMSKEQGHRLSHVLDHTVPNLQKSTHTVFSCTRSEILSLIDDGFKKAKQHPRDFPRFEVDMSPRVIGTGGETKMRIVIDPNTKEITTAYPIKDVDVTVPGI